MLATFAYLGCGGATSPASSPTDGSGLVLREMRYVIYEKPTSPAKVVLAVHADGRVERPGSADAHFEGGRLVCVDGEILRVEGTSVFIVQQRISTLSSTGVWSTTVVDVGSFSITT